MDESMKILEKIWQKKWIILGMELALTVLVGIVLAVTFREQAVTFDSSSFSLNLAQGDVQEETAYLEYGQEGSINGPAFRLGRGVYELETSYQAMNHAKLNLSYQYPEKNREVLQEVTLPSDSETLSYRFYSKGGWVYLKGRLSGDASEGDYLLLSSVTVKRSKASILRFLVTFIFGLLLIDSAYLFVRYISKLGETNQQAEGSGKKDQCLAIALLVFSIFGTIPLWKSQIPHAPDLSFHLMRIEGLYEALMSGVFPVRIQPGWLGGYGYPVSALYGDAMLVFPAFLRIAGFTLEEAYRIFGIAVTVATVYVAYHCLRVLFEKRYVALFGAVLYSGCLFHFEKLYEEAQVGGYSAMLFYPLVAAGLYLILAKKKEHRQYKWAWLYLVLGYSGLLHTHMISCLMIGMLTVIVLLVYVRTVFTRESLVQLGKAALAGILVNLWYLIPFFTYFTSGISSASPRPEGMEMAAYLSKVTTRGVTLATVLGDHGIGFVLGGVILLYIILLPLRDTRRALRSPWLWLTLLTLWFGSSYFPYVAIATICPPMAMIFNTIQMAWRFVMVAAFLAAALGCDLIMQLENATEKLYLLGLASMLVILVCHEDLRYFEEVLSRENRVSYVDYADFAFNETVGGEFMPIGTNLEAMTRDIILSSGEAQLLSESGLQYCLRVNNAGDGESLIQVPRLYYPGYKAWTSEGGELSVSKGDNNRVAVAVPGGYQGEVVVDYHKTFAFWVGDILSLLSVTSLVILLVLQGRKSKNADVLSRK